MKSKDRIHIMNLAVLRSPQMQLPSKYSSSAVMLFCHLL